MKLQKKPSFYKNAAVSVCRFVFLIAFAYILLYPVFYMLSNALRTTADYIDPSVVWVPKNITMKNFSDAFKAMDYVKSLTNTLIYEMVSALIEVFVCAVYAYGLSRFKFRFQKALVFVLVLTILLPDVMLMLPRMINFKQLDFLGILGLVNRLTGKDLRLNILGTPFTFYLPSLFGVGLKSGIFIFIYMQFFGGLPRELEEAAYIDGSGPLRTFLTIIIPSAGVAFLTVLIFSVIWHWNDYYLSTMYLGGELNLSSQLANLAATLSVSGYSDSRNIRMAACLLFVMPMLAMYMILQRQFIKSIDHVGIVG